MIRLRLTLSLFLTMIPMLITLVGCTTVTSNLTFNPMKAKPPADYIEPITGMDFMFVERGSFLMGDNIGDGNKRELPVHEVTINNFAVGRYEVTFSQYDKFCEATGYEKPVDEGWGRDNRPVINVSWHDATAFAEWLSEQTGQEFSLPSEAQWEYFARAGTTTRYWMGDEVGKNAAQCNDCINKFEKEQSVPVGSFRPNPWGIYDTAGNVNEWCQDNLHRDYLGAPEDDSPWLSDKKRKAMHRGGGWSSPAGDLRSSGRDYKQKNRGSNDTGFRLTTKIPVPVVQQNQPHNIKYPDTSVSTLN